MLGSWSTSLTVSRPLDALWQDERLELRHPRMSLDTATATSTEGNDGLGFAWLDTILERGSSLRPEFIYLLDGILAALFLILALLLVLTRSLHFVVLMVIVVGLWASVRWCVMASHPHTSESMMISYRFVYELQNEPRNEQAQMEEEKKDE